MYLYVLVRSDLGPAQASVQAAHAVLEAGCAYYDPQTQEHPHLIILSVRDERALFKATSKLSNSGYDFREFREPDLNHELTAIACRPVCGDDRAAFARYPLMDPSNLIKRRSHEQV